MRRTVPDRDLGVGVGPGWRVAAALLATLLLVALVTTAWLGDDAFISFRTVENLLSGRGMTWNPGQRVQVFTHPLWLLLLTGAAGVSGELPATTLFVSLALAAGTVVLLARQVAPRGGRPLILLLVMAIGSKAFVDYASSGLENPLAHFLAVLFFALYLGGEKPPELAGLLRLSLVAALLFVTRPDLALVVGPPLAHAVWQARPRARAVVAGLAGLAPAVAWELFSLVYFGSLVPNTAYAKLATGISTVDLLPRGLAYWWNSLRWDPLTLPWVAGAVALACARGGPRRRWAAAAIVLYLAYGLRIGGDFMSGRLLSLPFVVALLIALPLLPCRRTIDALALAAALVVVVHPRSSLRAAVTPPEADADRWAIADERAVYGPHTGLLAWLRGGPFPDHPWAVEGAELRQSDRPLHVAAAVGMLAYHAGPWKVVADPLALTDPLLARLPVRDPSPDAWRIGHYPRNFPAGYLESLATGENRIVDPHLRRFYDHLRLVVSGPLLAPGRLATIVALETGRYDGLLESYLAGRRDEVPVESVLGKPWRNP